ncbi:hypothetical protein RISK_006299 [Rhodopirellula islandica]|uniref:Uncharacterized protein n=1 Tax=Rhodopirellula islandica TaxID=595434 RepID=A0A0J1E899_RHOIS|nr:hypothetical protein RISK_006299 [Rhodopirellula islandica]
MSSTVPSGHTQTPSRGDSKTQRVTPFAQRVATLRTQPRKRLRQTFYSHPSRTVVLNCSVWPHSNAKPRQIQDATCHTVRSTRRDVAHPATQTFETNVLLSPESNSCPQLFRLATFKRQAASIRGRSVSHRSLNASRHCSPSHANV